MLRTLLLALLPPVFHGTEVVWYGHWSDPDPSRDEWIFIGDELVVQEGVTTVEGSLLVGLEGRAGALAYDTTFGGSSSRAPWRTAARGSSRCTPERLHGSGCPWALPPPGRPPTLLRPIRCPPPGGTQKLLTIWPAPGRSRAP